MSLSDACFKTRDRRLLANILLTERKRSPHLKDLERAYLLTVAFNLHLVLSLQLLDSLQIKVLKVNEIGPRNSVLHESTQPGALC